MGMHKPITPFMYKALEWEGTYIICLTANGTMMGEQPLFLPQLSVLGCLKNFSLAHLQSQEIKLQATENNTGVYSPVALEMYKCHQYVPEINLC